jgi:hypothetical protein
MAQGVPGSLWPRIFLTFGTMKVVGRQPYAPAAFTPEEIPKDNVGIEICSKLVFRKFVQNTLH